LKKYNSTVNRETQVVINISNGWNRYQLKNGYILYKGNFSSYGEELNNFLALFKNSVVKDDDIINYLACIRGNFSIIVKTDDYIVASVDCIRSIPLYYFVKNSTTFITDDVGYLKRTGHKLIISNDSQLSVLMSGYTLFEDTLYLGVKSFIPGQIFSYCSEGTNLYNINNFQTWFGDNNKSSGSLKLMCSEFNDVVLEVMENTINSLNNRQVVVPLSGGYDSRLIVSLLRYYNYENVICFTYGMVDNFEAISAKKIAQELGYKWIFIDLNIKEQQNFYKSDEFPSYLEYADTVDSVPYYQGLSAVKYLKEKNLVDSDAIFINGNSGDFITGGHISNFYQYCNSNVSDNIAYNKIIDKYYSLWGYLKISDNINEIIKKIKGNHKRLENEHNVNINICDFIYYYEFINRQSKFVIQGQKVYEYYGYEWRIPLWDLKMIEFWNSVPNNYKNGQFLYKKTIEKYNYSNIWDKEYGINKYRISSPLIRHTRRFLKLLVLILTSGSHKKWDRIDRSIFFYFYDITRQLCSVSYWRVVFSIFKYPRHHVSFDAERYVSHHEKSS
jgi:asparagine synthase (glutamine-hydrolysing)